MMYITCFPLTHHFVAQISALLKGGDASYWYEMLKPYRIRAHCKCTPCYTFTLECDEIIGPFDSEDSLIFMDRTMIVMHHCPNGTLSEFEIPVRDIEVPYAQEYKRYFDSDFVSDISEEEAKRICERWFSRH